LDGNPHGLACGHRFAAWEAVARLDDHLAELEATLAATSRDLVRPGRSVILFHNRTHDA
jgi:hypothetical protein